MNQKLKFVVITTWIVWTRSYDAYCTSLLTPDLSKEANPLVSVLGIDSWFWLLMIVGGLTAYVIYTYYLRLFRPMDLLPAEGGYSFSNMVAYTYLGKKTAWWAMFYQLPNSWKRFNHYMGALMTPCLVYAGLVSTIMWVLINHTNYYQTIHSAALVYTILIAGCLLICYYWNRQLYKAYIKATPVA
jgi:hypothetical protein